MIKYYYIIVILALYTCTNSGSRKTKSLSEDYTDLKGGTLPCDSDLLTPWIVSYFNSYLVTMRYSAENLFTVYHVDKDQIKEIGSFGKEGTGPYEFTGSVNCYYDPVHNYFYIFDIINGNNAKSYQIDVSSVSNLFNVKTWKQGSVHNFEKCYWESFTPLSDSLLIALGGSFNKRI